MNGKKMLLMVICAILLLSVYTVDLFKLNYRMTGWKEFGEVPVVVSHIQYFIADTPDIIGYTDHALGEEVTCFETVAFVETDRREPYRCCDAGGRVSCLAGDFSSDIPPVDEQCVSELRGIFGATETLTGTMEHQFFGRCTGGRFAELTVVRLDDNGMILWKHVKVETIQVAAGVLRCVAGPLLLLIILYTLYKAYQERTAEPVRRF